MKTTPLFATAAMACILLVPPVSANRTTVKPDDAAAKKSAGAISTVTRAAAEVALSQGATFMLSKQIPDGSWLQHPAITSLAVMALLQSPEAKTPAVKKAVERGLDFVVKFVQPDGSIWNKANPDEYPNYTTSIATIALVTANRPQDQKILRAARDFLLGSQFKDVPGNDESYGGIGYGKAKRPDLSNTQWALEALKATEHLDQEPLCKDPAKAKEADLAWNRALQFVSRCQNLKETNDQTWVSTNPDDKGGFIYKPGESKAGTVDEDGAGLRSYGSMTYAGLKSMVYAKVSKDDPRVKAAIEWISHHYTFDENPGMKDAGLYYYLHTCAKALSALGTGNLVDSNGVQRAWREEFIRTLVAKQKVSGEWVNANGRWWESQAELSTAYSMMALGIALGGTP